MQPETLAALHDAYVGAMEALQFRYTTEEDFVVVIPITSWYPLSNAVRDTLLTERNATHDSPRP